MEARSHRPWTAPTATAPTRPHAQRRAQLFWDCFEQARARLHRRTTEAFYRYAVNGEPASAVADSLGMTRNAVYLAKYKVLRWIRQNVPDASGKPQDRGVW